MPYRAGQLRRLRPVATVELSLVHLTELDVQKNEIGHPFVVPFHSTVECYLLRIV